MAEEAARQVTGSREQWTAFLTTAARLYKYPYNEQLMIYKQRPDATACAEYDLWNKTMRRYVRRGSKGIALVNNTGSRPKLRYVFDVSDTGARTLDAAWVLKSNTSMKSSGSKQPSGSSTQREQSIYLMLVSAALRKDTPTLNSSYP